MLMLCACPLPAWCSHSAAFLAHHVALLPHPLALAVWAVEDRVAADPGRARLQTALNRRHKAETRVREVEAGLAQLQQQHDAQSRQLASAQASAPGQVDMLSAVTWPLNPKPCSQEALAQQQLPGAGASHAAISSCLICCMHAGRADFGHCP